MNEFFNIIIKTIEGFFKILMSLPPKIQVPLFLIIIFGGGYFLQTEEGKDRLAENKHYEEKKIKEYSYVIKNIHTKKESFDEVLSDLEKQNNKQLEIEIAYNSLDSHKDFIIDNNSININSEINKLKKNFVFNENDLGYLDFKTKYLNAKSNISVMEDIKAERISFNRVYEPSYNDLKHEFEKSRKELDGLKEKKQQKTDKWSRVN